MGNFIKTQKSFINGEVSPTFFTNDNLNGLSRMENLDVMSGGGLVRRPGLKKIAKLPANARLVPFSVDENQEYIIAIMNGCLRIFSNDTFVQDVIAPWGTNDIKSVQYAQRFGTMIFVHPDYAPRVLRKANGTFQLSEFTFSSTSDNYIVNMPFTHFADSDGITITVTSSDEGVHLTTNQAFWTANNVGGHLMLLGKTWIILSYVSATDVIATCNGAYTLPADPVSDWQEATFSPRRGWPSCITFHQDRLVFGGAKSWPAGIWMSRVGEHTNFNTGTGLDDDAIYFTLLSGRRQHVCTLVSSDSLQILTSEGEWVVSSTPVTPTSISIKMHTTIGSVSDIYLPAQQMEGKTVFVSHNKKEIRELVLDALGENYNANNLCELSNHLMNNPIDIAYNKTNKKLFVVMDAGYMAVMNYNPGLNIAAWGRYTTNGTFCSVAVSDTYTYVVAKRNQEYFLEKFVASEMVDADTKSVQINASGIPLMSSGHNTHHTRIKKIVARVHNTKTLLINNMRAILPQEVYDDAADGFYGDVSMNVLGTNELGVETPWSISTTDAMPIKILSITIYGRYQI